MTEAIVGHQGKTIFSNRFPEYKYLSLKSKALLNVARGSLLTWVSSLITSSVGLSIIDQGALNHNAAEKALGHDVAIVGAIGMAASVVGGLLSVAAYVEASSTDEERALAIPAAEV